MRLRGSIAFRRVGYKTYWYGWDGKKGRFLRIHRCSACFYFDHWSASIQYSGKGKWMVVPFFVWKPRGVHLLFGRGNISYHRDLVNLHSLL